MKQAARPAASVVLALAASLMFLPPAEAATPERWRPPLGTTWHWQLTGRLDEGVDVQAYDIDLFRHDAATVERLHARGIKVICYISAGSWERFRPDARRFPRRALGRRLEGFPDERWLDIRSRALRRPLLARIRACDRQGYDAIEYDNVDGYTNNTGFRLTARDQLRFNRWLAREAHKRGMAAALKNDLDQIPALAGLFDMAVNEQCFEFRECEAYEPFVRRNKAVLHVEYEVRASRFCDRANRMGFSSMFKRLDLDAYAVRCWELAAPPRQHPE